ncbi:MAG: MFS transporter [Phycisphaeraceae bacterium]|nr:MFS transporter [Phycisphaeraceae bacterium]
MTSDTLENDRSLLGWWTRATPQARKALIAGGAGWMLDGMDIMLYALALKTIAAEFDFSKQQSGMIMAATLFASAFGGVLFGVIADKIGRVRALMISILLYSVCTAMCATAQSLEMLVFWRLLTGLGMGGEWAAGSVLIAETWSPRDRGKAIGVMQSGWALGYLIAAALAAFILPSWRLLFVVGAVPALAVFWIRRHVPESETWSRASKERIGFLSSLAILLRAPYAKRVIVACLLTTSLMCAYWGLFTWIPAFLASPISDGGAGLTLVNSATWIIPVQIGAFLGYFSFGFLADWFGRRAVFVIFTVSAAILVPIYGFSARHEIVILALGPLIGFFGHGYFSVFGSLLAELFPSSIRATAQGLCYNFGRGVSAASPWLIGAFADRAGLGTALAFLGILFFAGAGIIFLLPNVQGKEFE